MLGLTVPAPWLADLEQGTSPATRFLEVLRVDVPALGLVREIARGMFLTPLLAHGPQKIAADGG